MKKNFSLVLVGIFAVLAGAVISVILLKNKFKKQEEEFDIDDYCDFIDDDEFEQFIGEHDEPIDEPLVEEVSPAEEKDEDLL